MNNEQTPITPEALEAEGWVLDSEPDQSNWWWNGGENYLHELTRYVFFRNQRKGRVESMQQLRQLTGGKQGLKLDGDEQEQ